MSGRDDRLAESRAKILPPFRLDDSMRFYCPQENVDSFRHLRVHAWLDFMRSEYEPALPGRPAILLLLPCTKTKPYPASLEHRRINASLLADGFGSLGDSVLPELGASLPPDEDPRVLDPGPLVREGVVVHRMVVSEPLALVPYEYVYVWRGEPSPATAYDDPGLFEHRGTSVCPWRRDCTAQPAAQPGRYRWGDAERASYVEAHNYLSATIAEVLGRIRMHYDRIIAWVSPGLTHRSFMFARQDRPHSNLPAARRIGDEMRPLIGVNDLVPGLVDVHPTKEEVERALDTLTQRLAASGGARSARGVRAYFARGGGGATPLALPELQAALFRLVNEVPTKTPVG